MPLLSLKAHYDGKQIVLDEPFEFPPNAMLAVTVLAPQTMGDDEEQARWVTLSAKNLARAYGDDEPEYTLEDIL